MSGARYHLEAASRRGRLRRSGGITPFLLVSLMMLLGAFAVAVDYIFLWQTRVEMQTADDAAALAAAQALVDDNQLTGDPAKIEQLIENARTSAVLYAQLNRVVGQPAQLDSNPANLPYGDFVLGTLSMPSGGVFVPARDVWDPFNVTLAQVNAIRVVSPRTQARGNPIAIPLGGLLLMPTVEVIAGSTALLDRDVVGFRLTTSAPLPFAPIALLSDPTGANPVSWDYLIVAKNGPDQFRFDRQANAFLPEPQGDGIHEMLVTLALPGNSTPGSNGCLLNLGSSFGNSLSSQLLNGLTAADLAGQGGQIALGPNNQLLLAASPVTAASGSATFDQLQQALQALATSAAPRIWPLYTALDTTTGIATIQGFVAARVVQVNVATNGPLTFILQPTMIASPDAITDFTRRGVGGVNITNSYVVKVRLVP